MSQKKTDEKFGRILDLVLEQIADVYLYFLGFYIVCLIMSLFLERWQGFFNWPAFHAAVVALGILSLASEKGKKFILSQKRFVSSKIVRLEREPLFKLIKFPKSILTILKIITKNLASAFVLKIKGLTKKDYLKIGLILLISIYFLSKEINPINFLVLAYALVSILFIIESRISASIALLFLISCPILLILKKEGIAETMAIYAYYFLVITVVTQIREYWREEKVKKVIHS